MGNLGSKLDYGVVLLSAYPALCDIFSVLFESLFITSRPFWKIAVHTLSPVNYKELELKF